MLGLSPTLTNSIGVEGLLGNTYDNLRDTSSFDITSKFYKPEVFMNPKPSEEVTSYYLQRDPSFLKGISLMGPILCNNFDEFLNEILRLEEDNKYWKDVVSSNLECVKKRLSTELIQRVLSYNITNLISNLKNIRESRRFYQQVWAEYTN